MPLEMLWSILLRWPLKEQAKSRGKNKGGKKQEGAERERVKASGGKNH
jgi:hypothetical protein